MSFTGTKDWAFDLVAAERMKVCVIPAACQAKFAPNAIFAVHTWGILPFTPGSVA
jgi:hypothetical protein